MYNPGFQPQQMQNNKYKTQLCRHFAMNGSCALGVRCQFAHGQAELRSNQMYEGMESGPYKAPTSANYKTQLCKHFNPTTGLCKNGPNCTFAHGDHELNNAYMQNQQFMQNNHNMTQGNNIPKNSELTQQILVIILQNMEGIFPGQNEIIGLLQRGQQLASIGQTQEASDIIKQVIHDASRSKEEKQQYQQIYNNAQKHYEQKMRELQTMQQPQFNQY